MPAKTKHKKSVRLSRHTHRPLPDKTPAHQKAPAVQEAPAVLDHHADPVSKFVVFKLGEMVTDSATGLNGMLTHLQVEMNLNCWYHFQPRGLNPEDGSPVKGVWIASNRVQGGETITAPVMPLGVLGTDVEDLASGFKGTAIALILHINGCLHISIQPRQVVAKTGAIVDAHDFDIRRVKGAALVPMTEAEIKKDEEEHPSPAEVTRYQPGTP